MQLSKQKGFKLKEHKCSKCSSSLQQLSWYETQDGISPAGIESTQSYTNFKNELVQYFMVLQSQDGLFVIDRVNKTTLPYYRKLDFSTPKYPVK